MRNVLQRIFKLLIFFSNFELWSILYSTFTEYSKSFTLNNRPKMSHIEIPSQNMRNLLKRMQNLISVFCDFQFLRHGRFCAENSENLPSILTKIIDQICQKSCCPKRYAMFRNEFGFSPTKDMQTRPRRSGHIYRKDAHSAE